MAATSLDNSVVASSSPAGTSPARLVARVATEVPSADTRNSTRDAVGEPGV